MLDETGTPEGTGFCEFDDVNEAQVAMSADQRNFGPNIVYLRRVSGSSIA